MTPIVSIIMGSTSDLGVMKSAAEFLDQMEIPFEINALSAHRVPEQVMEFAQNAHKRGYFQIRSLLGAPHDHRRRGTQPRGLPSV